jgi:hypothetical protein
VCSTQAIPELVQWGCSLGAAYLGALVFLALAAKEWDYREAWLRIDGERRAKKAKLEAEIRHNQAVFEAINRAGREAASPAPDVPTFFPNQPRA